MITWRAAQLEDVDGMVALSKHFYSNELDPTFDINPPKFHSAIAAAIIRRNYNLGTEVLQLAHSDGRLVAWTWMGRGLGLPYSETETAEAHIIHIDLGLSTRQRVRIINDTLETWENWCKILNIPVLISTSIRRDWLGFMELHRRRGWDVRGSHAFKIFKDSK